MEKRLFFVKIKRLRINFYLSAATIHNGAELNGITKDA